jgi:hypothetical protein
MHSPLYDWRKTIAGFMLLGVVLYALIPLFGMAAHRFLPPHEHFMLGSSLAAHHHADAERVSQELESHDCFAATASLLSGQRLVHPIADASAVLSTAAAIGFDSGCYLYLPRNFIARLTLLSPHLQSLRDTPLHTPPNLPLGS